MSHVLSGSGRVRGASRVIIALRVAHALVALGFFFCMAVVYLGAWRGEAGVGTFVACGVLFAEGMLVLANRGDCPLTPFLQRLGDETPLFELVLPPRAARLAVPVLGAVTGLGFLLLLIRVL